MKIAEVFSLKSNAKFFSDNINIIVLIIIVALLIGYVFNGNKETFYTGDYEFVMYYTNWCGYSKRALPGFNGLGNSYTTESGKTVNVRKVDCDSSAGKSECNSQNIRGYPTIKLFKKNNSSFTKNYEYSRETGAMKNWLNDTAK